MQRIVDPLFQIQIHVRRSDIVQIFGNTADIFGNRHIVIVENDDKIRLQTGSIVQRFISHTARQRAVPDNGNNRIFSAFQISCLDHAEPSRYGSGTVSCIKAVAVAFFSLRKTADAAVFPQVDKAVPPPCQYFMGIGLMPYIPDNFVFRQMQRKMQRHRQFHRSQVGTEMPARHADSVNQKLSDFFRQRIIIFRADFLNIIWFFYFFQKHCYDHAFLSA